MADESNGLLAEIEAQIARGHERFCVGVHTHDDGQVEEEWVDWRDIAARLAARVRELEAGRQTEHENVTATIDTLIQQRDEAQETVRLFQIAYGEPGTVRDLAEANAQLAALRAARQEPTNG